MNHMDIYQAWADGYAAGREYELGETLAHIDRARHVREHMLLRKLRAELSEKMHRRVPELMSLLAAGRYAAEAYRKEEDRKKLLLDDNARRARAARKSGNRVVRVLRAVRDTAIDAWNQEERHG